MSDSIPDTAPDTIEGLNILFKEILVNHGISQETAMLIGTLTATFCLLAVAWLAHKIVYELVVRTVQKLIARSETKWDDALVEAKLFRRFAHFVPALIISTFNARVFAEAPALAEFADSFVNLYLVVIVVGILFSGLEAVYLISQRTNLLAGMPLKGVTQAGKLVIAIIAAIIVLSILMGKSPVYFLSGIGALAAVLMMVFKDAILGFTGGIMLAANQMVRVGDWIEMPSAGADGDVIDVSLTTVKVQNWDKTIVTIPAYSLASSSFKNWRGMSESGGRRIKRSIAIDMKTVRFADEKMLEHWRRIDLLKPYLDAKLKEIGEANQKRDCDLSILGNGRCLTNLGTFRAYCEAYLRAHAHIHQGMTLMVRQLQPTELGLPLELYTFTSDIRWVQYEGIQSDIFDHLLAIVGEFGLSVYQNPSSTDVRELKTSLDVKKA